MGSGWQKARLKKFLGEKLGDFFSGQSNRQKNEKLLGRPFLYSTFNIFKPLLDLTIGRGIGLKIVMKELKRMPSFSSAWLCIQTFVFYG